MQHRKRDAILDAPKGLATELLVAIFLFFGFVFIECLFIMLFMLYKGNIQIQASESSGQYQDVSSMVSTLIWRMEVSPLNFLKLHTQLYQQKCLINKQNGISIKLWKDV